MKKNVNRRQLGTKAPLIWTVIIVAVFMLLAFPKQAAAAAPFSSPLPGLSVNPQAWASNAGVIANSIYSFFLIIELVVIAIVTLFFRENLGEFFASVIMKVFAANVYFFLIANSYVITSNFMSWIAGLAGSDFGGSTSPWQLIGDLVGAAATIFASTSASAAGDYAAGASLIAACALTPPFVAGYGTNTPCGFATATIANLGANHQPALLLFNGLGALIISAAMAILLQFILVTIESYIVIGCGVLFLGFAGSRWTMPLSQNYMTYVVTVGVKMMVTYIVIGIAGQFASDGLYTGLAGLLVGNYLGAPYIAYGTAVLAALYVVVAAAVVWSIPNFASGLVTGQSSTSGGTAFQQSGGMGALQSLQGGQKHIHDSSAASAGSHTKDTAASAGQGPQSSAYAAESLDRTQPTVTNADYVPPNTPVGQSFNQSGWSAASTGSFANYSVASAASTSPISTSQNNLTMLGDNTRTSQSIASLDSSASKIYTDATYTPSNPTFDDVQPISQQSSPSLRPSGSAETAALQSSNQYRPSARQARTSGSETT